MIFAELDIRHTRKHMPTRRVALASMMLPMAGAADGLILIDAVLRTFVPLLDEEQRSSLDSVVHLAKEGRLAVPGISMRYRLQLDQHGLDRSRHRVLDEPIPGYESLALDEQPRQRVIEVDTHGPADPQVLGIILAMNALPPSARQLAFRSIDQAIAAAYAPPTGYRTRFLAEGVPRMAPTAPGATPTYGPDDGAVWASVQVEQRWAMEVLGLRPDIQFSRDDVQQRFRRLLRLAHPDQGAEVEGAGERISELTEAREILLACDPPNAAEV